MESLNNSIIKFPNTVNLKIQKSETKIKTQLKLMKINLIENIVESLGGFSFTSSSSQYIKEKVKFKKPIRCQTTPLGKTEVTFHITYSELEILNSPDLIYLDREKFLDCFTNVFQNRKLVENTLKLELKDFIATMHRNLERLRFDGLISANKELLEDKFIMSKFKEMNVPIDLPLMFNYVTKENSSYNKIFRFILENFSNDQTIRQDNILDKSIRDCQSNLNNFKGCPSNKTVLFEEQISRLKENHRKELEQIQTSLEEKYREQILEMKILVDNKQIKLEHFKQIISNKFESLLDKFEGIEYLVDKRPISKALVRYNSLSNEKLKREVLKNLIFYLEMDIEDKIAIGEDQEEVKNHPSNVLSIFGLSQLEKAYKMIKEEVSRLRDI